MKDQLKEKIALKKMTDEEILRARSIVSVNRLKLNGKGLFFINNYKKKAGTQKITSHSKKNYCLGTITEKMKENISTLARSLQTSHQQLTKYERLNESTQSSQDESDFSADQVSVYYLYSTAVYAPFVSFVAHLDLSFLKLLYCK